MTQFNREEVIATHPLFMRARQQLTRLQDVIDYGIGDANRAARIIADIQPVLEQAEAGEWYVIAHGNSSGLRLVLAEWKYAIDSVCAEVEREVLA